MMMRRKNPEQMEMKRKRKTMKRMKWRKEENEQKNRFPEEEISYLQKKLDEMDLQAIPVQTESGWGESVAEYQGSTVSHVCLIG